MTDKSINTEKDLWKRSVPACCRECDFEMYRTKESDVLIEHNGRKIIKILKKDLDDVTVDIWGDKILPALESSHAKS